MRKGFAALACRPFANENDLLSFKFLQVPGIRWKDLARVVQSGSLSSGTRLADSWLVRDVFIFLKPLMFLS